MELEDITIAYEENGEEIIKEEDKFILAKGAWSTVAYLYRQKDKNGEFGDKRVRLVRYKKRNGKYLTHAKFNLTGPAQVEKLVEKLNEWYSEEKSN
jgi:hypothetical protein